MLLLRETNILIFLKFKVKLRHERLHFLIPSVLFYLMTFVDVMYVDFVFFVCIQNFKRYNICIYDT